MAYVDDPNKNSEQTQVAGASPLGNIAPAQDSSMAPTAPQGDSGSSQIQSTAQPASTNKKAKKASSGMFTNIQKYVDKNKPQAQNMANAVTGDVSKQAEQIRKSVDSQKAQQSKTLTANTQAITGAQDWASNMVGNITGTNQPAPTETSAQPDYSMSESNIERFQNLMGGNVQGVQDVGNLSIAEQTAKTQALQKLAGSANTEQGRRNLLGQTFQKQGQYGRGMSGLDNLITSGDNTARESLIQGTQDQTKGLQDSIQGTLTAFNDQKAAQDLAMGNVGKNITGVGSNAVTGIRDNIDDAYEAVMGVDGVGGSYNTLKDNMTSSFGEGGDLTLSNEDLAYLGIESGTNLFDLDPMKFLRSQPKQGEFISADQIKKLNQLGTLTNTTANDYGLTEEQAAGMDYGSGNLIDKEAFNSAIEAREITRQGEVDKLQGLQGRRDSRNTYLSEIERLKQLINKNVNSNLKGTFDDVDAIKSSYQYDNVLNYNNSASREIEALLKSIEGMDDGYRDTDPGRLNFGKLPSQAEIDALTASIGKNRIVRQEEGSMPVPTALPPSSPTRGTK